MVLGKLPVPGRPTILMTVGQGPIVLAVGVGGSWFGHFCSPLSSLCSFSLSLGDGLIQTEILSQRAVKPKTTDPERGRKKREMTDESKTVQTSLTRTANAVGPCPTIIQISGTPPALEVYPAPSHHPTPPRAFVQIWTKTCTIMHEFQNNLVYLLPLRSRSAI